MISLKDLRILAKAHLLDSEILFKNKRYDGSIYICGYAIEITLKLQITKTLRWTGFPENNREFTNFTSFKTHNLDVLLQLSGKETIIKDEYLADWSIIAQWEPAVRYRSIGNAKKIDAQNMISSSRKIMSVLGIR